MLAEDLISEIVPPIQKGDKAAEALNWMDVFKVSHLPIVEDSKYLGIISDADIFDTNTPEAIVYSHRLSLKRPFVRANQHIYEVAHLVSKYKLTVIPVLSETDDYLGVITVTDLAQELSTLMSPNDLGGIIVLEVKINDYSLSEIAQIVEGNDVKILSLYVRSLRNTGYVQITIKLNTVDILAVVQTFERYSYKIKATFAETGEFNSMLQDRLDSFMKYLNI